jgi:hypothetical protein
MRRESSYEKAFARICKQLFDELGLPHKYVKTVTPGRKGWPDRLLLFGPMGHHLYIEWKQPGEEPDPMQVEIHTELKALGAEVRWYDNHYSALVEVEAFVRAKTGTDTWDEADRPKWWSQIILKAWERENVDRPKKLRSVKEIGASRRAASNRAAARNNDVMAVGACKVGGLPPSIVCDNPWWEN